MAELKGKKRKQPSSCPEGWAPGAVVVQLELTHRQERHARRCVGIARFVYNRLVANDQAGRDTGLWLTPHELEKEFNAAKQAKPFPCLHHRGQQVRGPGRVPQLPQRPFPLAEQRVARPAGPSSTRRTAPAPDPSWPRRE